MKRSYTTLKNGICLSYDGPNKKYSDILEGKSPQNIRFCKNISEFKRTLNGMSIGGNYLNEDGITGTIFMENLGKSFFNDFYLKLSKILDNNIWIYGHKSTSFYYTVNDDRKRNSATQSGKKYNMIDANLVDLEIGNFVSYTRIIGDKYHKKDIPIEDVRLGVIITIIISDNKANRILSNKRHRIDRKRLIKQQEKHQEEMKRQQEKHQEEMKRQQEKHQEEMKKQQEEHQKKRRREGIYWGFIFAAFGIIGSIVTNIVCNKYLINLLTETIYKIYISIG